MKTNPAALNLMRCEDKYFNLYGDCHPPPFKI